MEQKTPEWYNARLGKFTASEFYKLMCGGRRDMTPEELTEEKKNGGKRKTIDTLFGDTALSYIDEKIVEILTNGTGCDFGFQGNKSTEWGEYWEPIAREKFEQKSGYKISSVGFMTIAERFGGSPDGKSLGCIIEIKCPYNSIHHYVNLRLKDASDLKQLSFNYYVQCQVNLIASNEPICYFISFDPRMQNEKFQMKIISVERDEKLITDIWMRYQAALKILNDKIDELFKM